MSLSFLLVAPLEVDLDPSAIPFAGVDPSVRDFRPPDHSAISTQWRWWREEEEEEEEVEEKWGKVERMWSLLEA